MFHFGQKLFRLFAVIYNSHKFTKKCSCFHKLSVSLFILDASQYAQYVFNTIKRNQTGKISFEVISFIHLKLYQLNKIKWFSSVSDLHLNQITNIINKVPTKLNRSWLHINYVISRAR